MGSPASDSWALGPGAEIVPGCVVHGLIGGGVEYEVYSAFDERRLCPIVVKALRPGRVDRPRSLACLRREIDVVGLLNHPAIVRGLHASLERPRPYLGLELVPGPRLSTQVRTEGPADAAVLVPLAMELAAALHYLHGLGYVHLDVKPGNVILGSPPRLVDLSLACHVDELDGLSRGTGTDGYRSPEIDSGEYRAGPWSDIWGLGMTLAYAATGDLDPGALPDLLPEAFRQLVNSMTAPDPGSRPSAVEAFEVADALAATLPAPRIDFWHPSGGG